MSEAIKLDLELGEDWAYSMPLDEIDVANPVHWTEEKYWALFERMRKEAPVHYGKSPREDVGHYWSITRYDDIMAIDTDHKRFSSDGIIVLVDPEEDFTLPMFIAMDPPKHDVQRKTVQPIVAPDNLSKMEGIIRERTQNVLDSLPRGEVFDWVDKVSIELTTLMLATLFDFPLEDRRKLTRWSDVATADEEGDIIEDREARRAELYECLEYFTRLWNERVNADPKPDLISMLAHGENTRDMHERPLEYLGNLILLIVGGNDTTRNSMTGGLYALNKFPQEYQKLRDNPGLIPNMVSEMIRWQTPLAYMRRTALEDVEMRGKTIRKGDKVVMWYASGNRDENGPFENPNDLIIDRPNARRHLSFGFGIHRCVGNRLAELQLTILWEEIMKRFKNIEVVEEPERIYSSFVKGYSKMLVRIND